MLFLNADLFKNTYNKEKSPFLFESDFFVMFGGCPYFLSKKLDKAYNKQLRSYDPVNWKKFVVFSYWTLK